MASLSNLRKNVGSLFVVQIANYLVPLLVLPYLLRVLGPDGFGRLAFVLAAVQYLVILTDFGFNLSATRQIAECRNSPPELARLFWSTTIAKLVIGAAGVVIGAAVVVAVPALRVNFELYAIGCVAVLGTIMLPAWWFQGNERLQLFAFSQLGARIVCACLLFIFVQERSDLEAAVLWQSAPLGAAGLLVAFFLRVPRLSRRVRWQDVASQIAAGWNMFVATSSISLYTTSNVFVLGLVAPPAAVGYFSFVERVIRACAGLITPIFQAVYPRLSSLRSSRSSTEGLLRSTFIAVIALTGAMSFFLVGFSSSVTALLGGPEFVEAQPVLLAMAAMPLMLAITSYFGTLRMASLGLDRSLSRILLSSGVLNFCLVWVLGGIYQDVGAAVSVMATEILISILMIVVLKRRCVSSLGFPVRNNRK